LKKVYVQEGEIWIDVPGYEGYYQVSSHGRVKSLARLVPWLPDGRKQYVKERLLAQGTNNQGRMGVVLSKEGIARRHLVSRLVLMSFKGTEEGRPECRHLDGNHLNNRLGNLEWGTHTENMRDKQKHGTQPQGEGHPKAKLTEQQVIEILSSSKNHKETGKLHGVSGAAISFIRTGKTWKHVFSRTEAAATGQSLAQVWKDRAEQG
jgi:hypothetical protein